MAWKNNDGSYSKSRPHRVRLPDGMTRTGPEVTDQLLVDLGWYEFDEPEHVFVPYAPAVLPGHELEG